MKPRTDAEIIATIERLMRAQPRNPDTLLVCEELSARLTHHGRMTHSTDVKPPTPIAAGARSARRRKGTA